MAPTKAQRPVTFDQLHAFRLARHHLLDRKPADPVMICGDVCGVQAQIMSAGYLQIWARSTSVSVNDIEDLLWRKRTLVKTSLMRQTLHLIAAEDFHLYISALRASRAAPVLRIMAKFGITEAEANDLTVTIVDALASGPLSRQAIRAHVKTRSSKRVRAWMEKVWSIMRLPVSEGLVCYGEGDGNEAMMIRTEQWLPALAKKKMLPAQAAQAELLRRYLHAYGPASMRDFSHWSGIPMAELKKNFPSLPDGLAEIDGRFLLSEDASILHRASAADSVHLLPSFDVYLLAHAAKDHLLEQAFYKRVYRNQGWISPVVLVNGIVVGVWSYEPKGKRLEVVISPFRSVEKSVRAAIEERAESLGQFFSREALISFSK